MTCLDEDSVLAFIDGSLGEAERINVAGHLVICAPCADLVATSVGGRPEALARQSLVEAVSNGGGLTRGATVGRYVILELVGRGGMGEVYAAYDPRLDRKIALKLLRDTTTGRWLAEGASQERLLREAQSIARLSHPNVVVVHDAGAIDDESHGVRVYLAMEFIEGQTLAAWLAEASRPWRAIRDVFVAAAEGLLAAHEAGLVHRDFKPQNVMVGRDGGVRVMDFGLARDTSEAPDGEAAALDLAQSEVQPSADTVALTGTGVLLGTPLYMAPEQFLARATDARTDQFGFCIALYEALYGERPFRDASLSVLVREVVAGRVREPPQKARVPTFLRKIVLRGLQVDPAARYSSMREVIAALRADPVRHGRTIAIGTALAAAMIVTVVGAQRITTRGERMCRGGPDRLAGIWELDGNGQRRAAVHNAFFGTGSPLAAETWSRVAALLDDYSRRWSGTYTDSCEATHVRGDQSAEVLDLRSSCLDGLRGSLRALSDVLSHADGNTVIQAVNAAHALPSIDRCSDVTLLRAVVPPPANAAARAQVVELERQLAEVKALADTGKWIAARRQAKPLAEAARALGYEPLLAETLAAQSWLEIGLGDVTASVETAEAEVHVALAAHRDDLAAEAAGQLFAIEGGYLDRREESQQWEALAGALLRSIGPGHDRLVSWFHQDRADVLFVRGEYRKGIVDAELALELKQKVLPSNHPDIARALEMITLFNLALDDGGPALAEIERAFQIDSAAFGSSSPLLWVALDDRGEVFELLHRHEEAERDLRLSLSYAVALFGPSHPWTAHPSTALGKTLIAEGKYRAAAAILEEALRIRESEEPYAQRIAETRFALARARWALNRDRAEALKMAVSARDAYRLLPGDQRRADEIDAWLVDKPAAKNKVGRVGTVGTGESPTNRPHGVSDAPPTTIGSIASRPRIP